MTDPFSIIVGSVALADVCIRLTKFLKQAKDGFQKIDKGLEDLSKEITALRTVSDLIKHSFETDLARTTNPSDNQIIINHWQATRTTLAGCQDIVERLNALITAVLGTGGPKHVKFNNLRKYLKHQSKDDEFIALRQKLNAHYIALQTSLAAGLPIDSMHRSGFVVYGLPGSGKTQFCCKFASENKQSFWGVFWIDASSNEHAKQSFSTIARIGRVEPNERAAKNWLSSLGKEKPWLLIIDNADEISFPIEDYYPDGDCGIILITTRNPMLKVHGTIAPRYYHFDELKETESIELLLRAADESLPWAPSTLESAKVICRTLGYLPLALMHAGKTILAHIFLRAASDPRLELLEQERREQEEKRPNATWRRTFKMFGFGILAFLLKLGYRPVLPKMLSDAIESNKFDELRLREALKELFQMSLVFANPDPKDDSYSMHPAVHLWVRERPEMTIADQAVWCQATATILTQAILLLPLGDKEEDEILRRDLLPHVHHVQNNEDVIRARFVENQESRKNK
ncbi:MAG: hypothetical protein Q9175_005467 [Cornicularia normoerica]